MWKKEDNSGSERQQTLVLIVQTGTESGRRGVTEFFDERLRGFVCERAAVQSAEFVLIQHMVKKKKKSAGGILGVCTQQVGLNVRCDDCN